MFYKFRKSLCFILSRQQYRIWCLMDFPRHSGLIEEQGGPWSGPFGKHCIPAPPPPTPHTHMLSYSNVPRIFEVTRLAPRFYQIYSIIKSVLGTCYPKAVCYLGTHWSPQIWASHAFVRPLPHATTRDFPSGSDVKGCACNTGDLGSIPGLGRSHGEANGNPLQYSCLENPMDGGAWPATVHGVPKNQTRLNYFTSPHAAHC